MKKFLSTIILVPFMVACAGPKITPMDVELERARSESKQMNMVNQQRIEIAKMEAISKLPPEQIGLVMMGESMAKIVEMVITKDDKQPMGFYEMKASVAKSQNDSLSSITGSVITGAIATTGIIVGGDVIKKLGSKTGGIEVKGDGNTVNQERNTTSFNPTSIGGDSSVTEPSTGIRQDSSVVHPAPEAPAHELADPETPKVEAPKVDPTPDPTPDPGPVTSMIY